MKELYTFKVNKKTKSEKRIENDDGSFTIKPIDAVEEVVVYLKLPSRRDKEEISLTYKEYYGKAISRGLPMADVLRKNLLDSGGVYSRSDLETAEQVLNKINEVSNTIQMKVGEDVTELEKELEYLNTLYDQINKIDRNLWANTAEAYAQDMTMHWAVLNLTFWDKDKKEVFPGVTFDSKLTSFYEMSDEPERFSTEIEIFSKSYKCFYAFLMLGDDEKTKGYLDFIISE